MDTNGFSVVTLLIPSPLLAIVGTITLFVSVVGWIWFLLWWKRAKQEQQINLHELSTPPPRALQEIYVEEKDFFLFGPKWLWIGEMEISYGCPVCHKQMKTILKHYLHEDGDTFSILRHECFPQLSTKPIQSMPPARREVQP